MLFTITQVYKDKDMFGFILFFLNKISGITAYGFIKNGYKCGLTYGFGLNSYI